MNNMIRSLIFAVLLFHSANLFAQGEIGEPSGGNPIETQPRGKNIISCSAYDAITFNNYKVSQVEGTYGQATEIQELWGTYSSTSFDEVIGERIYHYNNNEITFLESDLTLIEIRSSSWPVIVMDKSVQVGDSFSDMKQKFGSSLKIVYMPSIDNDYAVSFNCSGNDGDGIQISFDTTTHKVNEIIYYINP
jgi:hypothetical protein